MVDSSTVLTGIPGGLREPLIKSYQEIETNFAEHRWEPTELNGGKFCEVVYAIVAGVAQRVVSGEAFEASEHAFRLSGVRANRLEWDSGR